MDTTLIEARLADGPAAATAPAQTPRSRLGATRALLGVVLVAVAAYVGHEAAFDQGLARVGDEAEHRLDMLAVGLDGELTRFDFLPALLEMAPDVSALLREPRDAALRDTVNRYLLGVNATAGAEMLYVLDAKGVSLAASDWDRPGTTLGQDLSFRPYVIDAFHSGRGRFYGVGVTSRRPGYYLSYALQAADATRGVVAVKVNLEQEERSWKQLPGDVLLIDDRGVVILSTRPELRYRPLHPLDAPRLDDVRRTRAYGDADLRPIGWTAVRPVRTATQIVEVEGVRALATTRSLGHAPWQLVALDSLEPVRVSALLASFTAGLAMAAALLVALVLMQRRRSIHERLANQAALQAAHDNLESTVVARTAQLRSAQDELVHAGKLAALGQMSAGLVHELNQPLTALRSLSDSVGILLRQQRHDDVHEQLQRIGGLVGRLARLTTRLKTFAYRQDYVPMPIRLSKLIHDLLGGMQTALDDGGVDVRLAVPPEIEIESDEAAVASIVTNIVGNAIDAMRDAPSRVLEITASREGDRAFLSFRDSGPGIRPDILPRLFQPFVTSKPAGLGLGLGLVISAQLLQTLGGTLKAQNRPEGGAVFVVELPARARSR